MNPERPGSPESVEPETSHITHHPELHDPHQEIRLDGVETLSAQKKIFHRYPAAELTALQQDFQEIPEVIEYQSEPARLDFWLERFSQLAPEILSKKVTPTSDVGMLTNSVATMLQGSVERYSETVRQFRSAEIKRFHLEPEEFRSYMQNVDSARRRAHEALIDSVKAFSRTISQKIPSLLSEAEKGLWQKDVE